MDKIAVWKSVIKGFGVYKVIETEIIFNKDIARAIEGNKSLERSLKYVLEKYKASDHDNVYCISSLMYKWSGQGSIFKLNGARMVTAKTHKYLQDTVFIMERQKEAAESIIKILEASVSAKSDTGK